MADDPIEEEFDEEEIDVDLEGEDLEGDLVEDLEEVLVDAVLEDEEDEEAVADAALAARPKREDEDDEEEDLNPDDVEADLDAILREKLTAADDSPPEEDEEDVVVDDKTDGMERLQPRRPDETQCAQCFLLVRNSAPGCPVEDDACPLFK